MTDELVAEILARFDDRELRTVYADALTTHDEARAELIVLGCALEAAGVPTVDALIAAPLADDELALRVAQHRRVRELVDAHGTRWWPELAIAERTVSGGFLDHVAWKTTHDPDAAQLRALLAREPVRSLRLDALDGPYEAVRLPPSVRALEADLRILSIAEAALGLVEITARGIMQHGRAVHVPRLEALATTPDNLIAFPPRALRRLRVDAIPNDNLGLHRLLDPARVPVLDELTITGAMFGAVPDEVRVPRVLRTPCSYPVGKLVALDVEQRLRVLGNATPDGPWIAAAFEAPRLVELAVQLAGRSIAAEGASVELLRGRPLDLDVHVYDDYPRFAAIARHHRIVRLVALDNAPTIVPALADAPPHLRDLAIRGRSCDDDIATAIATLPGFARVRRIRLDGTSVTERGIAALSEGLRDLVAISKT